MSWRSHRWINVVKEEKMATFIQIVIKISIPHDMNNSMCSRTTGSFLRRVLIYGTKSTGYDASNRVDVCEGCKKGKIN